jgi:hypothetical protein
VNAAARRVGVGSAATPPCGAIAPSATGAEGVYDRATARVRKLIAEYALG